MTVSSKIEDVKVDDLRVDGDVQRSLNPRRVDEMVSDFHPEALGVISVSRREDGMLHIVDGQHRVAAARSYNVRADEPIKTVKATVYDGLNREDEASLFRVLNNTRIVGPYDKFRVRLIEGDQTALELNKALHMYGYHLSPNNSRNGGFQAVASLEWVYRGADLTEPPKPGQLGHIQVVKTLLNIVTSAWDHDPDGVREAIIRGMGKFLIRYGDRAEPDKLVRELMNYGPGIALYNNAKQLRTIHQMSSADAVASILTQLHNRKRSMNRLPEWTTARRMVLEGEDED